jgi:Transposase zinc-binding domain
MPAEPRQVIDALCQGRTEAQGAIGYHCTQCGHTHTRFRRCGNRHCPGCQHHNAQPWLENQVERQLPGPHFLLTFTVPEPLRPFLRSHQRLGYDALFAASAGAIKTLAPDPKFIGSD